MNNQESLSLNKSFLLVWLLATLAAFLIGFPICFMMLEAVDHFAPYLVSPFLGISMGAVVGYSQWLVLRKQLHLRSAWGLAYVIGFGVPFSLTSILSGLNVKCVELSDNNLAFITVFTLGSLWTGFLQSKQLRPLTAHATRWVAITTFAWLIATGITFLGQYVINVPKGPSIYFPSMIVFSGVFIGLTTGIGLKWLLRSPELPKG
jgi:hypothetical protein